MSTPDYCLIEDVQVAEAGGWETKTLKAGTFVRPIDYYYVPKHIKEAVENRWFIANLEVFCFTPLGIKLIDKNKFRRVNG